MQSKHYVGFLFYPGEKGFEPLNVGSKFQCHAEQFDCPLHTKSWMFQYCNLKVCLYLLAPSSCGLRAFAFQLQCLALSLDSMFRQHRCSSLQVLLRYLMLHDTLFGYVLVDTDCS